MGDSALSNRTRWPAALGWAVFLAASWTWCIGMYLPVLLVRDFGLWGWIVFAVPNVLGAAAMGWVLRRQTSESLTIHHLCACAAFSWVTIAFHVFFALWIIRPIGSAGFLLVLVGLVLATWVMAHRAGWVIFAAAIAWIVSADVGVVLWTRGALAWPGSTPPAPDVVWLAGVCVFGFLLCPYLDLTFHRARQSTSAAGARVAFSLGFGGFFLAMIVLTLLYAELLPAGVLMGALLLLAIHLVVQSGFTIGVHLSELTARRAPLVAGGVVLCIAAGGLGLWEGTYHGLSAGEVIYRLFMGFYGLVFPAYVWICLIPTRGQSRPTWRMLITFAAATILALPAFWMGFIERQMIWIAPGLAIILLARLVAGPPEAQQIDETPLPQQEAELPSA